MDRQIPGELTTQVSLVVCDLGGVLVRIARSWSDAVRLAGFTAPSAQLPQRFAEVQLRTHELLQLGTLTSEDYYDLIAVASEGIYDPADVERIHQAWSQDEYPGIARVFDALDASGVPAAVLSNTSEPHWRRLFADGSDPEYPTRRRARYRFASHILGVHKPDPEIYRAVAHTTAVPPHQILFFDDVEEYVVAARDAGWSAERIDPDGDPAAQMLTALHRHGLG